MSTHPAWAQQNLTILTLAATGIKPADSELCGYALMLLAPNGTVTATRDHLVRTTAPIPTSASNIHGLTTQLVNSNSPLPEGVRRFTAAQAASHLVHTLTHAQNPIVVFNAPWVFDTITALCQRAGVPFDPTTITTPIIDPLVLDKRNISTAASGGRTLSALCDKRGLPKPDGRMLSNAYSTGHLALDYINRTPMFRSLSPAELGESIAQWFWESELEYEEYVLSRGRMANPPRPWVTSPQPAADLFTA